MISASSVALGLVYRWAGSTMNPTGQARAVLRRALKDAGLPDETVSDGVLAASELVANAHEHAGGPYEMYLRMAVGRYICEIHDRDPVLPANLYVTAAPSREATASEDGPGGLDLGSGALAERGRGLRIVHELTDGQWGFLITEWGTKAAWIALAADSAAPCRSSRASAHNARLSVKRIEYGGPSTGCGP